MKNNKKILSIILVIILIIVGSVLISIHLKNKKEQEESRKKEYDLKILEYEKIEKYSNDINTKIDEELKVANEIILTNFEILEDKTVLENLKNNVKTIEDLKIKINEIPKSIKNIEEEILRISEDIKKIDEKLFEKDKEKFTNNIDSNYEILIEFSEESNINKKLLDIKELISKVEEQVKSEKINREEKERLEKIENEKKEMDKILNGDYSYFVGTYIAYVESAYSYGIGDTSEITITKDGIVSKGKLTGLNNKPSKVIKNKDGSYKITFKEVEKINYPDGNKYTSGVWITIYPIGVKSNQKFTSSDVIRLEYLNIDVGVEEIVYKKSR